MEQLTQAPRPGIKYKTFTFHTQLDWIIDKTGILGSTGKPGFHVSSPPEFKGEAGVWSPEDLFVASVDACTMTTFATFAQRLKLPIHSYTSKAEGILEFVDGGYRFTKIILKPKVIVESFADIKQSRKVLHDAHTKCLIANSIRAEVVVEPEIASQTE